MKKLLSLSEICRTALVLACFAFAAITYAQDTQDTQILLDTLRIMTYNIQHGAGMDDVVDLDRQAAVIRGADAHIVGLQEVDSVVKRSGYIAEAAVLGQKLGMYATFGPAIPLTRGKYGVAILSKEKPLSHHNIPLPGSEKRTLLVCEFQEFVFACTHLDLDEENRMASLDIILEEAARHEKPFFICGDWNDKPSSKLLTQIKKKFTIINIITDNVVNYTYPASTPKSTIDYIASYGVGTNRVWKSRKRSVVLNEPEASDHRPVLVEITMVPYTTDISSPLQDNHPLGSGAIYDLSGRQVNGQLPRGLYIQNGKKIVKLCNTNINKY